jgi:PAS domain S-box-containing protein
MLDKDSFDTTTSKQSEEQLKTNEAHYRRLFETAKDGILIIDATTGMVLDVNPFLVNTLGYPRHEIVNKPVWELGFLKGVFADKTKLVELQQREYVRIEDLPLETAEGQKIDVELAGNVYDIEHQKLIQLNIRNISERKKAELELRESETRFRSVLDNSQDVIYQLNMQTGRFEYISPSARTVTGFSPDELMAMDSETALMMIHPDDLNAMESALKRLEDTGKAEVNYRQKTKNGDYRWLSNHMSLVRDSNLRPLYRYGNIHDINDRTKSEDELARLASIVESSSEAIIGKTLDGVITSWNTGASQLYGYSPAEAIGQSASILVAPDHPDEIPEILNRVKLGELIDHFETTRVRKDGVRIDVSMTISPIKDFAECIIGASTIAHDISFRKRTEKALSNAKEHLEDQIRERTADLRTSNEELIAQIDLVKTAEAELRSLSRRLIEAQEDERRLISMELHDEIGQHLTILKMMLDTMSRHSGAPNQVAVIGAADEVGQIIGQVRNLSMQLHPSMLDVLGLEPTLQVLFERVRANAGLDIKVTSDFDDDRLNKDAKLGIYRIIQESLTNVMRYSEVKKAQVTLHDFGDHISVTVKDEGKGFDPRALGIGKSAGISGMKERARTLGGTLIIESAPGKGTTIKVQIPHREPSS